MADSQDIRMGDDLMNEVIRRYKVLCSHFRIGTQLSFDDMTAFWQAVRVYEFEVYAAAIERMRTAWGRNKPSDSVYPPQPFDVAEACRIVHKNRASGATGTTMLDIKQLGPAMTDRDNRILAHMKTLLDQGVPQHKAAMQSYLAALAESEASAEAPESQEKRVAKQPIARYKF